MNRISVLLFLFFVSIAASAKLSIKAAEGWLEECWIEWNNDKYYNDYAVYVSPADKASWTRIDAELVRNYGAYGRADVPGLKAGTYLLKVVPVNSGKEEEAAAAVSQPLVVKAHDRSGFAHYKRDASGLHEGIGAYRNDGTLKDGAIVLYVTANNAKTISVEWQYSSSSKKIYTGICNIIDGFRKCTVSGGLKKPLCVRVIGLIKKGDMDRLSGAGLQIKSDNKGELPLTVEGIGNDATLHGFGIGISNCSGVEVRNLGIMLYNDDGISVSGNGNHLWLHNNDIFYGSAGKDADQVKGDGAIDIKQSQHNTVAYTHFFDCGKCSLLDAGAKTENWVDQITYHHNWFDHSDQRNPRCRNGRMFHVYNNYYDGNGLYGIGLACGASVFAEGNYFRNCKFPVLSSAQGSDKQWTTEKLIDNPELIGKGYLSGENGGICKWYDNLVVNANSLRTQHTALKAYSFDIYEVLMRDEKIPAEVKSLKSGTPYSNFDTDASSFYPCTPDAPADVPDIVTGQYGAGRIQHGDFKWQFDNAQQDESETIINELKDDMLSYKSTLVGFYAKNSCSGSSVAVNNGGGSGNSGGDAEANEDYVPTYVPTTAIDAVQQSPSSHPVKALYNLAGQKVAKGYKGLVKQGGF